MPHGVRWINRKPRSAALLAAIPLALLLVAYLAGSSVRLAENPNDKLMPAPSTIAETWSRMAFEPDTRTGTRLFWEDTAASLRRMGLGLGIATTVALGAGLFVGMLPYARATFSTLVAVLSMIPALSILPILFIVFGVGELAKVVLIVIGVLPFMVRDLTQRVVELPLEQWVKAQTLGASSWQLAVRVVLPQILPRLIDALRLSLGPAWLFLISAEAISATSGLGYRIFLVRRYLAMDVILPYVLWITLLAFAFDLALRLLRRRRYGWLDAEAAG
ncbi:MAG: ABC transporter permease subunit [Myxococcota bacterium]|nr:ABC transporter permease subunit [Myxococcota bacterium]